MPRFPRIICIVMGFCLLSLWGYAYPHEFDNFNRAEKIEAIRQYKANGLIINPYYRWTAGIAKDPSDAETRIYTFLLFSENKLPMPHYADQEVSLLVKVKKKPNSFKMDYETYVNWKRPVGKDYVDVIVELDGVVQREKWVASSNKEATFPRNAEAFVQGLKFTDELIISVKPEGEDMITAFFDVRGLSAMMRIM